MSPHGFAKCLKLQREYLLCLPQNFRAVYTILFQSAVLISWPQLFKGCIKHHSSDKYCQNILSYLTIIPRARMGSESIAHEAEGGMDIDSEAMRAIGIIVLVKSN